MALGTWDRVAKQGLRQGKVNPSIYDIPVFHALLRHEKSRVDREGKAFTLVVLEMNTLGVARNQWKGHIHKVKALTRTIDEIGWLDDASIGVILPATSAEGARRFKERMIEATGLAACDASTKLFSYPDNWLPVRGESDGRTACDIADRDRFHGTVTAAMGVKTPYWKRAFDIAASFLGMLLLSPLFLVVGLYIKAVSPGPVFFRQQRVGFGGKLFTFYKFRSMKQGNDQDFHKQHIVSMIRSNGNLAKLDDRGDPRIIPGGKFLRKSCIDELPQLFNVLRGDMSLVGPRPCLPYEAEEFLRWHAHRFDVLPGMTGLWQVSGKNKLTLLQMIRLDISYSKRMSLKRDFEIILMTVPAIVRMFVDSRKEKVLRARETRDQDMKKSAVS